MSIEQKTEIVTVDEVSIVRIAEELRAGLSYMLQSSDGNVKAVAEMMSRDVDTLQQITEIALTELKRTLEQSYTDVDAAFKAGVEYGEAKALVDAKPAELVSNVNGRLSELVHNEVARRIQNGDLSDVERQQLYNWLGNALTATKHVLRLVQG